MSDVGGKSAERVLSQAALLFEALREGETRALARAVSLVEDGAEGATEMLGLCRAALRDTPRALRVGITGPAGAGKSTLVAALTRELRGQGRRVGIVAVDPSSPFSGGAILGDRIRLAGMGTDAGMFMRSMATRGHLGGLAKTTDDVLTVIEAGLFSGEGQGRDVLLIETTGVGQGEVEVAGLAEVVAVVLVPGMGDGVQSLKAGVLEIASVFVLNKADREGIDRLESEIREMLALSGAAQSGLKAPAVVKTVATSGVGMRELLAEFEASALEGLAERQRVVLAEDAVPGAVLDHIGIAVRSIEDAQGIYRALGAAISEPEVVMQERVRVVMIAVGESRIELLEAMEADSTVGRFLAKRGEGIHHIALRVADLGATMGELRQRGVRLVSEQIQVGAGGHRYVFVHPASANGVLLEIVESGGLEHGGRR